MADITIRQIENALEAQDPLVTSLIIDLASQPIPYEDKDGTPYREGAPTFPQFLSETRTSKFRKKSPEEQEKYRVQQVALLAQNDAEIPFPERLKLHQVILSLWQNEDPFSRETLKEVLKTVPLTYGPWRALKIIFKKAEEINDTEIYAILSARIDTAIIQGSWSMYGSEDAPTRNTLLYMRRRAWQYLRRVGETLPAIYPDVASDFLCAYESTFSRYHLRNSWVVAHIFFHEFGEYTRNRFKKVPTSLIKYRAFNEVWLRSPRPLFNLLEKAQSDVVLKFATDALKTDFRASLREVEPEWVVRLFSVQSNVVHELAVWILENVPKFEQSAFRELGIHEGVLKLLDSNSQKALKYVHEYVKTHARDLEVDTLIHYAGAPQKLIASLAQDLILERDARKDIGLDRWGQLINQTNSADWVKKAILKYFS